jgi:hypothetical protein
MSVSEILQAAKTAAPLIARASTLQKNLVLKEVAKLLKVLPPSSALTKLILKMARAHSIQD